MSLAVLPSSPISCSGATAPGMLPPSVLPPAAAPSKRPKLSLNTSSVPTTFGKSSTSLRLETLSVTSPTSRNTFSNAYGNASPVKRPSSGSERPKLSLNSAVTQPHTPQTSTPLRTSFNAPESSSTTSATSDSSTSTLDSSPPPVPYRIAYNTRSILANGPLPRPRQRMSLTTTRPMFPAMKRVSFRAPLTEEIKTEKYTLAHSDLASSSSTISTLNLPPPEHETNRSNGESRITQHREGEALTKRGKEATSARTGDKRDSSDDDSDTCPATPVAGRRKRRREWVWTLGPIGKGAASSEDQRATVTSAIKQT